MSSAEKKIGLSLSGGGYRATAFHLGTLRKLDELKILPEVDVLSTISGGSIIGAYYCLKKVSFKEFEEELYRDLQQNNVLKIVFSSLIFYRTILFALLFIILATWSLFTPYPWLFPIIMIIFFVLLVKLQFSIFPVSKAVEKAYDQFFYNKATLGDLPATPILVIGSTNLQTARPFSFSKTWMQDSTYQYLKDEQGNKDPVQFISTYFPVARAVMASSCVPFAFTPVRIEEEYFKDPDRDFKRVNPQLVDGGVYDNQGIHKIMQGGQYNCQIVITSDAGSNISYKGNYNNFISLLVRSMDVFMARIKNVQMVQDIYDNTAMANKEIAYLSLGWDIENCIPGFINNLAAKHITKEVIEALKLLPEWVDDPEKYREEIKAYLEDFTQYNQISKPTKEELVIARSVATNLTPLSKQQVDCLIKQAEGITEIQVKLYCPTLIKQQHGS